MKKYLFLPALFLSTMVFAQTTLSELFVNQEWVLEHLYDSNLVILHVGNEEDYNTGHIRGARLITSSEFSRSVGDLRWEIPVDSIFEKALAERGVTNATTNLIYFGNSTLAPAFRLYFTMKYFGLSSNTYILDGGLPGWYSRKRPVSMERVGLIPNPPGLFLWPRPEMIIYKEEIMSLRTDSLDGIIDARRPDYFTGKTDGDGYYQRSGHIPGAVNITWLDLFDHNKFLKPEQEIRKMFLPLSGKQTVVTYCHVGLRATVLYSISSALGFNTRLYDGSFTEWDKLGEEYPIQKGN